MHLLGLMPWRGGVLLAAAVAGYEVARILSPSSALATVLIIREDTRGNAMDPGEYAVTYLLIRTELDWRITPVLPHDLDRAPWTS